METARPEEGGMNYKEMTTREILDDKGDHPSFDVRLTLQEIVAVQAMTSALMTMTMKPGITFWDVLTAHAGEGFRLHSTAAAAKLAKAVSAVLDDPKARDTLAALNATLEQKFSEWRDAA
jgi:hypothetical protein